MTAKAVALVAIEKRMIHRQVEQVSCRLRLDRLVQQLPCKRRLWLNQRGLQQSQVANARSAAKLLNQAPEGSVAPRESAVQSPSRETQELANRR